MYIIIKKKIWRCKMKVIITRNYSGWKGATVDVPNDFVETIKKYSISGEIPEYWLEFKENGKTQFIGFKTDPINYYCEEKPDFDPLGLY
jgi:hypothetical protein